VNGIANAAKNVNGSIFSVSFTRPEVSSRLKPNTNEYGVKKLPEQLG